MLFKMAFRHIVRHKRRSILSGLTMGVGALLCSLSYSLGEGMYADIISMFTTESVGHIQIYKEDYLETPAVYKSIKNYNKIMNKIEKTHQVKSITPRIRLNSLGFFEKKTTGVQIFGLDFAREKNTTELLSKKLEGRLPRAGEYEVVISNKVAKVLRIAIGKELVMIGQGADGSIANDLFKVVGIADFEGSMIGDGIVITDISSLEEYGSLYGRVHELVIRLENYDESRKIAALLEKVVPKNLSVYPWEKSQKTFYISMKKDKAGNIVMLFIIMLVVALGVLNAVFMNVYERMKEYAIMKSIGVTPRQIFLMIVSESVLLSFIALIPSMVLAYACNYYLSQVGIQMTPMEYGGVTFSEMTASLAPRVFILPSVVVVVMSFLASILPGVTAARANPCKLMRRN